jgi:hypothetical protein
VAETCCTSVKTDVLKVALKAVIIECKELYSSPSKIRMIKSWRMRWTGHVARMREKRNAYRILVGKPEGKGSLGRQRRRWWTIIVCSSFPSIMQQY